MLTNPSIELVESDAGRTLRCYALNPEGERVADLPVSRVVSKNPATSAATVKLTLYGFRVKRTVE